MPQDTHILAYPQPPHFYTTIVSRPGRPPLFLHCCHRYRQESPSSLGVDSEGRPFVFVPETLTVLSPQPYHHTLSTALSLFSHSLAPLDTSPARLRGTLETLSTCLSVYVPPPTMPLYLQIGGSAVHCQCPDPGELPLADTDFAPLLLSLSPGDIARLISLLLGGNVQLVVVSDHLDALFPAITSLLSLLFPFKWPYPVVPIVPKLFTTSLQSTMPVLIQI